MNVPDAPSPAPSRAPIITRRRALGALGAGVVGLAGARLLPGLGGGAAEGAGPRPVLRPDLLVADPDRSRRVLVVVELAGGNDGLATLVPYGDPLLAQHRSATAFESDDLIRLDDRMAVNRSLAATALGTAFVDGVGVSRPSGSHFDMMARWWSGDGSGRGALTTGFLGRLCDALDAGAPMTGVALAGATPALGARKANTLALPDGGDLRWLRSDEAWHRNLRDGLEALGVPAPGETDRVLGARRGLSRSLNIAAAIADDRDGEPDQATKAIAEKYPGGELSEQFRVAARLLSGGIGVRVIHTRLGGFDTHSGQRGTHDQLLTQLDQSVAAFYGELAHLGLDRSTLVCTTSEFGRRIDDNGSGTDHGTASTAMLWGPVSPGVHGETPSLKALDDDDNLVARVMLEQYYATIARDWFGIDPGEVLTAGLDVVPKIING